MVPLTPLLRGTQFVKRALVLSIDKGADAVAKAMALILFLHKEGVSVYCGVHHLSYKGCSSLSHTN